MELLFCTQKTKGSHQQQLRSTTPLLSALCDIDVAASVPEQARYVACTCAHFVCPLFASTVHNPYQSVEPLIFGVPEG